MSGTMDVDIVKLTEQFERQLMRIETIKMAPDAICRVEVEIPETEPLAWLYAQQHSKRIYFSDREMQHIIAGIGHCDVCSADQVDGLKKIQQHIRNRFTHSALRYIGGIRFPSSGRSGDWKGFEPVCFVIPRLEVIKRPAGCHMAFNFQAGEDFRLLFRQVLQQINPSRKQIPEADLLSHSREEIPTQGEWARQVADIRRAIQAGEYHKLVLARQVRHQLANPVDPIPLLSKLQQHLSNRYFFLFQFERETAFLGASMERLYRRDGREIQSEAIAGTIERGTDPESDRMKREQLLGSAKDIKEQAFVIDFIRERLIDFCSERRMSDIRILKLKESFHLKTRFNGRLKESVDDAQLVDALHPTPAVGGIPWPDVQAHISRYEAFDRGWYAGIVGTIGFDASDFAVALRSALIYNESLSLYAGVGLVEESEADLEWDEGDWKLRNFEELIRAVSLA